MWYARLRGSASSPNAALWLAAFRCREARRPADRPPSNRPPPQGREQRGDVGSTEAAASRIIGWARPRRRWPRPGKTPKPGTCLFPCGAARDAEAAERTGPRCGRRCPRRDGGMDSAAAPNGGWGERRTRSARCWPRAEVATPVIARRSPGRGRTPHASCDRRTHAVRGVDCAAGRSDEGRVSSLQENDMISEALGIEAFASGLDVELAQQGDEGRGNPPPRDVQRRAAWTRAALTAQAAQVARMGPGRPVQPGRRPGCSSAADGHSSTWQGVAKLSISSRGQLRLRPPAAGGLERRSRSRDYACAGTSRRGGGGRGPAIDGIGAAARAELRVKVAADGLDCVHDR